MNSYSPYSFPIFDAMKIIPVACALIFSDGKVLATQRSQSMDLPGKWEFPGGKVEEEESPEECLKREIREELSIEIELFGKISPNEFSYPSKKICLIPYLAHWTGGEIYLTEHEQFLWLEEKDLLSLDWAPADLPIVHELIEKWVKLVDSKER
ncbi:(deoxy)nucleoside triphosphate pyrophosphohydrolase [Algoriphagus confluentis]|uniref:8-oxo-dGTP diphosphatase n=1 Tax=Algoriphagus confluentis TaxID=1697556 RepID=A0ABQ6PPU5_9BACT|nr:(deoxy)nucleoside triphosphate pyrophosphohydrolase [Algoriphagus confluentis]